MTNKPQAEALARVLDLHKRYRETLAKCGEAPIDPDDIKAVFAAEDAREAALDALADAFDENKQQEEP